MRILAPLTFSIAVFVLMAGCGGGGQYGYARSYSPLGEEGPYLSRAVDLSYEEVRRTRPEEQQFISWFGVVRSIEDAGGGRMRISLSLRAHQDRHLCEGPGDDSCRVTVSERELGNFTALVTPRAEDLREGTARLSNASLLRIYGRATAETDAGGGPVIEVEWYRHWPPHYYVTTASRGSMRR
jgi:hypothetical protein